MADVTMSGTLKLDLDGPEFDPLKHLALINPIERRAVALNLAIQTKAVVFSFKETEAPVTIAETVVAVAKVYEAYIAGIFTSSTTTSTQTRQVVRYPNGETSED